MGFSLRIFLEELEAILEEGNISDEEKLEEIEKELASAKQYAKDCGQL